MASPVAGGAVASGVLTGPIGWAALFAASYIDARYIMPALAGKGRGVARPDAMLGVPVGSNEAGAPRIWAIGTRVRVPTHILWQDSKTRETTSTNTKQGTSVTQRQVLIDALIALNDRRTEEVLQLIGNGSLLVFTSRNLRRVTTASQSAAVSGSDVVLSVYSTLDPDYSDVFQVGDRVKLYGWVATAGAAINGYYWRVSAVTSHSASTPSTMTLAPIDGQTVTSVASNGGSSASPAWVERVDDGLSFDPAAVTVTLSSPAYQLTFNTGGAGRDYTDVFSVGDEVRLSGVATANYPKLRVVQIGADFVMMTSQVSPILPAVTPLPGGTTWPKLEFFDQVSAASGIFPAGYNPLDHYFDGAEDQDGSPLLAAAKGTGEVPGYRGVACIEFDDFNASRFGESLPFSLEAIIKPDASLTWAQAVRLVMENGGMPPESIDVSLVSSDPFHGYFVRGAPPPLTALTPLLIAGQLVGQENDGGVRIFPVDSADVVAIENGATYSALGARISGEAPFDDPSAEDGAEEDLPTSIGVRHQDPDNVYAQGYQHFGRRSPLGPEFENRQELDLGTLVLARKDARNLAATTLRRAHINRRSYSMTLDARYGDLLENDILTWTDQDTGEDITARVIQRDEGQNFIVKVVAMREDVDLAIAGSPVQTATGGGSGNLPAPASLATVVLDIPAPPEHADTATPGVLIGACAQPGSTWAGCVVWETVDGTNWHMLPQVLGEQAGIGQIVSGSGLSANTAAESYGSSTVTVTADQFEVQFVSDPQLEDASLAQIQAGQNWLAIVGTDGSFELVAFEDASAAGDGLYTLRNVYRGLRGTTIGDWGSEAMVYVLSGTTFAGSGLVFRQFPAAVPASLAYRFVPPGLSFADVTDQTNIVAIGRNALPLPVRGVTKDIGASPYDARFTIDDHWCRQVLPMGTQPPHPMDEPSEGYRLTIYDPTGATVRRIKTKQAQPTTGSPNLRDPWFDYPASEQTQDGYTPAAAETFVIDIQQIGQFGIGPSIKQEI